MTKLSFVDMQIHVNKIAGYTLLVYVVHMTTDYFISYYTLYKN